MQWQLLQVCRVKEQKLSVRHICSATTRVFPKTVCRLRRGCRVSFSVICSLCVTDHQKGFLAFSDATAEDSTRSLLTLADEAPTDEDAEQGGDTVNENRAISEDAVNVEFDPQEDTDAKQRRKRKGIPSKVISVVFICREAC